MKRIQPIGLALGFLAGTTLGSGIAFLMSWQPVTLMLSVAGFGLAGAALGGIAAWIYKRHGHVY
ncbi:hypothetical protein V3851_21465 [Paenibacillus sp. M1]|uniref:Uncharacterized protein n=1 Tax=Paenibacillus haidiansis TaxID=1574488 RepID=A0ABU7VXB3_9BACL